LITLSWSCVRALATVVTLLHLATAAIAGAPLDAAERERAREQAEQARSTRGFTPESVDLDLVVDRVDELAVASPGPRDMTSWIAIAMREVLWSSVHSGPERPPFRYSYPVDVSAPVLVIAGPGSERSHKDPSPSTSGARWERRSAPPGAAP